MKPIKIDSENKKGGLSRRNFLRLAPAGAAAGAIGLAVAPGSTLGLTKKDKEVKPINLKVHDDFPAEFSKDYQPARSYDTVHARGFFGPVLAAAGIPLDKKAMHDAGEFLRKYNYEFEEGLKGHDQLAKALEAGSWALSNEGVGPSPGGISDFGLFNWDQPTDKNPHALMGNNFVNKSKYKFASKQEASNVIKRAAKLYGASLVGITHRDERWDYKEFFNPVPPMGRKMFPDPPKLEDMPKIQQMMKEWGPDKMFHGWERFPFVPKTVIVMAFEMDYEAFSTAPSAVAAAGAGEGYSQMTKTATQMAAFIKQLGYHSVPAGNDTSLSVPYAIAAGLGEGSRMGCLVTFKYGPRVRIAKVYTDFDFVAYDKPKTFGVMDFCKNCMRCADACPSKAITKDKEPSFEPTHEDKDDAYFNTNGIKKYHVNARKCLEQWGKGGTDCGNCISSCPYNKPDFWHHQMINKIGAVMPGAAHDIMREMDIVFGYGNVDDPEAVDRFFDPKGKNYDGM